MEEIQEEGKTCSIEKDYVLKKKTKKTRILWYYFKVSNKIVQKGEEKRSLVIFYINFIFTRTESEVKDMSL